MSCANADTVKAVTVRIKRKSRCIAIEVMVRRKPHRTGSVFMFPLEIFILHRVIGILLYKSADEHRFVHRSTEGLLRSDGLCSVLRDQRKSAYAGRVDQSTCRRAPTINIQDSEPSKAMTAVMMKAQKNRPVLSTTKPVTTGAIHPARLPKKLCSPVHLPAACGPASVLVIAQVLEALIPQNAAANSRHTTESTGPLTTQAASEIPAPTCPTTINVLRTRVGVFPEAMQRSETHPADVAATAIRK